MVIIRRPRHRARATERAPRPRAHHDASIDAITRTLAHAPSESASRDDDGLDDDGLDDDGLDDDDRASTVTRVAFRVRSRRAVVTRDRAHTTRTNQSIARAVTGKNHGKNGKMKGGVILIIHSRGADRSDRAVRRMMCVSHTDRDGETDDVVFAHGPSCAQHHRRPRRAARRDARVDDALR